MVSSVMCDCIRVHFRLFPCAFGCGALCDGGVWGGCSQADGFDSPSARAMDFGRVALELLQELVSEELWSWGRGGVEV